MFNNLKKHLRFICLFVSIGFVTGIFYSFFVFQPVYKSASRILIDNESLLSQVYFLKSGEFSGKVWEKISEKHKLKVNKEPGMEKIKKAVNVKNPSNTNIIDVTAKWEDPVVAKDIVSFFISEYMDLNPGITVLDNPKIPLYKAFPGRFELITLFIIFSALIAVIIAIFRELFKNSYNSPEEIEQDLKLPVLGTIPWLEREMYDEPDIMFAIDETASFYSLAFQKVVSCFKLRAYNTNRKVFAFTSSEFSKCRSTIIMNTAYGLSRTGESVVVVDADFRTPSIGRDLGLRVDEKGDLTELLESSPGETERYTYSIPGVNNFFIIPNNGNSSDPSLYLYSDSFRLLVKNLKLKYKWVFIDVPPALAVPDAFTVGACVDGVILVTGLEPDKSALRKICSQFQTYGINIFGVIARELQEQEAVSANAYIKQMISQMMLRNRNFIAE